MIRKRICVCCGKPFETEHSTRKNCSQECSEKWYDEQRHLYNRLHRLEQRERQRKRRVLNFGETLCKICGKPVDDYVNANGKHCRKQMHEECIIEDAKRAVLEGKTRKNDYRIDRAIQRLGYTKSDLIEELIEEGRM